MFTDFLDAFIRYIPAIASTTSILGFLWTIFDRTGLFPRILKPQKSILVNIELAEKVSNEQRKAKIVSVNDETIYKKITGFKNSLLTPQNDKLLKTINPYVFDDYNLKITQYYFRHDKDNRAVPLKISYSLLKHLLNWGIICLFFLLAVISIVIQIYKLSIVDTSNISGIDKFKLYGLPPFLCLVSISFALFLLRDIIPRWKQKKALQNVKKQDQF